MTTDQLIAAVKARRAAAGLVAADGVHCPTVEMKAWHDARHGLTREEFEADREKLTALRAAALRSVGRA